ncbi:MAG: retropepsin-like aspartic protease, partial [Acidobacteriota bacterium]
MKRHVFVTGLLVIALAGATAAAAQQGLPSTPERRARAAREAERLLDLHLAWRGGREALRSLTFLERRGDIDIGGNAGMFRAVGARDGWLRYDVKLDGVQQVEAVTPHGGWRWVNGELTDLPVERIEAFRSSIDEMFGRHLLLERGYTARYLGNETRDGESFEVLSLSNGEGQIDLFLDGADGSLHWTREPEDGGVAWTHLQDWRFVDGVRFAFRSDRRPDEPSRRQLTEWKEVIAAGSVNSEEFLRPPARSGTLDFDGEVAEIPFDLYLDGYIQIDGEVLDRDVRVMLDSGAGITVLDRAFARSIGLSLRDAGTIQGIAGEEQLFLADGVDISIPGVTLRDATVAVLDLSEIADKMGRGFEVILGIELFTRALVTIDYPGRRLVVAPPRVYEPPAGASSVRMLSRAGIPAIACRFEALPETLCDVDTGSNSTVDIVAHYADAYDMLARRTAVSRVATGGVGGMIETPVSTLRAFSFAGVSVGSSPANFMADAVGSLDTDEIAGNIGAAV